MFNLLNIRNSKRGYSISKAEVPSPLIPLRRRGKQYAFTLAEVLITLVIIGIIAAITVPTLIVKYQKEQTVTRLKKAYSALAQTTNRAIADNGPLTTWTYNNENEYLSVIKDCQYSTEGECAISFKSKSQEFSFDTSYRFILNDGTIIIIPSSSTNSFKYIIVDINGKKKPNISGRDVFAFIYVTNYTDTWFNQDYNGKFIGVYPFWTRNKNLKYCKEDNPTGLGFNVSCAALIMQDSWKISDDYPW